MKRLLTAVSVLLVLVVGCAAPSSSTPSADVVRVASLKGPTTMGLAGLMGAGGNDGARISMYGTPDEIVPLLARGDADVALIPANLAAVLYNKTGGGVVQAAINTLGVLYVVERGTSVQSVADLRGRTIYSTGKGAAPEYVLDFLLARNGLEASRDVTVDYKSEATEVASLLAVKEGAVAVLPQPFVAVVQARDPQVRIALDLTREWDRVSPDSGLITGVLVVRRAFAQEHKAAFDAFLQRYRVSTAFVNAHPEQAAPAIVAAGIVPNAAVAVKAIPACNITYVDGEAMKAKTRGYLEVLFKANPASVGGSLPADDFFYQP